jgi:hypothetical protein
MRPTLPSFHIVPSDAELDAFQSGFEYFEMESEMRYIPFADDYESWFRVQFLHECRESTHEKPRLLGSFVMQDRFQIHQAMQCLS